MERERIRKFDYDLTEGNQYMTAREVVTRTWDFSSVDLLTKFIGWYFASVTRMSDHLPARSPIKQKDGRQGLEYVRPANAITRRTSENPFECKPDEARPSSTSPGTISARGRIEVRSTAPTANPARS